MEINVLGMMKKLQMAINFVLFFGIVINSISSK